MHRPSWFEDDKVLVSSAPTCGINKDGLDQFVVDAMTGERSSDLDDQLALDVQAVLGGKTTPTARYVPLEEIERDWRVVPNYFDLRYDRAFTKYLKTLDGWGSATLGELIDRGWLLRRDGHGSPSLDQRVGSVPYIKVSDLRAGFVNINPTNLVPQPLARSLWRGETSGLEAWDILCPERASKNIGDFCVLMPGQEQIVLTREVIVLRALEAAPFDAFFLMWALTLKVVRQQWNRIIFMQTNREDAGHRYREIRIPVPPTAEAATEAATPFRTYYESLAQHRTQLAEYLALDGQHHYFVNPD